ncbi:TPA: ash family protein [Mannheimia haemolytica]
MHLLKSAILRYYALAVAKSAAERGNSNISQTANSSTPFNRAFFVCSLRTPKENALSVLLSMVGRNGQRLIVGCIPFEAVFHPVMLYRQAWKLAVVPQQFQTELSSMIYLFKAVSRLDLRKTQKPFTSFPHYTLKVQADSVEQAQAKISRLFAVLSVSTMAEGLQYV